jgi:hypothetical protein
MRINQRPLPALPKGEGSQSIKTFRKIVDLGNWWHIETIEKVKQENEPCKPFQGLRRIR